MNTVILAVILVAGIGLIAGLILSIASAVMAVKTDEKVEEEDDISNEEFPDIAEEIL